VLGSEEWLRQLAERTYSIRESIAMMCAGPEGGHLGGSMSLVEVLTTLYFDVLRIDPSNPSDPDRDIFILSKGHGAIALYATLAERGFFPMEELERYGCHGSRLMGHPVKAVPGVEMPTGSLGHGLALTIGFALAAEQDRRPSRCYVVLGDGELQEGSVWEAAMAASSLGLDRIVAIVDRNGLQITGETEGTIALEPLEQRWASFGWTVHEVDGHDLEALARVMHACPTVAGRPTVLIAHTVKGRGVPAVEGRRESHYARLNPRLHARILAGLRAQKVRADGRPSDDG
jgi:transketolase